MNTAPGSPFDGTVLIVAPHMDDEVLACGGTVALLPQKDRVHVVYATDGMRSPSPVVPWRDTISPDLGARRMRESCEAVKLLGVPEANVTFLCLPEGRLRAHAATLAHALTEIVGRVDPDCVLVPFRFDRHPDHLVVNEVLVNAAESGACRAAMFEYFVYYRWRLLPGRDLRGYVRAECLCSVDIREVSALKRAALECFRTQTTRFYPWQTRPILTQALLDEVCDGPEMFVRYDPAAAGGRVFSHAAPWIRVAHRVEPTLKNVRYHAGALWRRVVGANGARAS